MRTLPPRAAAALTASVPLVCAMVGLLAAPAWAQDDEPAARPPMAAAAPAPDPNEPPRKRLDRLEREVNEVRQIVLQARATGHPVEIKDAGPDPEVASLQSKLDDIQNALANQTGQIEVMGHDLADAKQQAADARAAIASLSDRVDKLEKTVGSLSAPPPPPPPPGGDPGPGAPSADAAPAGDAKDAYAQARALMTSGDYAGAATAFQAYIDHYGDQPNIATARYWLGELKFAQEDYAGSAQAFIGAVHGWPQTSWAPDAVVKLSQSLTHLGKRDDACATLAEFDRRYRHAPAATRERADAARAQAQCAR